MRPVLIGDLLAVARNVARLPAEAQPDVVGAIVGVARAADEFRSLTGRGHPEWGNGSLYAAANPPGLSLPPRDTSDPAFLMALSVVCGVLAKELRGDDGSPE